MKKVYLALFALLTAITANAQWSDFSSATAASNLFNAMNGKMSWRTGSSLPGTCKTGLDGFLNTSTNVVSVCGPTDNNWITLGGVTTQVGGTAIGTESTINFLPGTNTTVTGSDTPGSKTNITVDINTNNIPTIAASQAGLNGVTTTSASTTTYTGVMQFNDPISAYTANMPVIWNVGSTACAGGSMTLSIDGLTAYPLKQADGSTNLTSAQCTANSPVPLTYDATNHVWRGPSAPGSTSNGIQIAGFSVCAAAGCILNETANWTYAVMVAGNLQSCGSVATVAPTGSAIIVDILKNGTSVFGGNPKPTVAVSSTSYASVSTFATASVSIGDLLTAKVTQVDSNTVGQFVRISCTIQ